MSKSADKPLTSTAPANPGSERAALVRKSQVLIVDDHPMTRAGLVQLIQQETDLEVCGQAGDRREALGVLSGRRVDLVITDISMPGRGGIELIHDVHVMHPDVPVLVVSMHDENIYAARALRAGARGYVMKEAGAETVLKALKRVLAGKIYLSRTMEEQIMETIGGRSTSKPHALVGVEALSDRELQVFELIGEGKNTKEIASRLSLSPKTVDVHRANIREKLRLGSSTSLLRYAVCWVESAGKDRETEKPPKPTA